MDELEQRQLLVKIESMERRGCSEAAIRTEMQRHAPACRGRRPLKKTVRLGSWRLELARTEP